MLINFTKMHSLGNDFVIIDGVNKNIHLNAASLKKIADRHCGVGCDQIIFLEPPYNPETDLYLHFFNTDGSTAEMCANGMRCAARFAINQAIFHKESIIIECLGGIVTATVAKNNNTKLNFGKIDPEIETITVTELEATGTTKLYKLAVGNPHGICIVPDLAAIDITKYGTLLNQEAYFPNGANISFAQIINDKEISMRTFERGCGPTLACGSATIAAFCVTQHLNLCKNKVATKHPLGQLQVEVENNEIIVSGPTSAVFHGSLRL